MQNVVQHKDDIYYLTSFTKLMLYEHHIPQDTGLFCDFEPLITSDTVHKACTWWIAPLSEL